MYMYDQTILAESYKKGFSCQFLQCVHVDNFLNMLQNY